MRIRHSSIVLIAMLACACAGPGAATPSPSISATPASQPAEATAAPATASPPASAAMTDVLEGTWSTAVTTCDQQNAALTKAGFTDEELVEGGWVREGCSDMLHGAQFTARFEGGRLLHFADEELGWDGAYRVIDDTQFEAGDAGTMYITYAYAIDGDRLTIDMLTNDYPAASEAELLGEKIAQTVVYESAPFGREGGGTAFESTVYPYRLQLPAGWSPLSSSGDEDVFEGPDAMTAKVGSAQPEPGQTVVDRVAVNRASEFTGCTTDPSADAPAVLGGEPAVRWSATCGTILSLATNTIHGGTGYRLLVALPDGPEAMATATAVMDVLVATFAFTN